METLNTHYSMTTSKKLDSGSPSITEQQHAEQLEIRNMVKSGFRFATGQPVFDDISNIPQLDMLLTNRRRLHNLYYNLPKSTRDKVETLDEFVSLLVENDESKLMELDIVKPSDTFLEAKNLKRLQKIVAENPHLTIVDGKLVEKSSGETS